MRIVEPIQLDGVLDEPAWQRADVIRDLKQREPDEGAPASQKTEVRVLYSRSRLYVGVTCYDTDPNAIVVTRFNRDANLDPDDRITLLLDTFHDRRNAFLFQTNAAGARVDELISDEGESQNRDWNGIWNVRTHIAQTGWSAEFEIPFQTLSFASDKSTWGFNIQRIIKRRTEESVWSGYRQNLDFLHVSAAGKLSGLQDMSQGLGLDFTPFWATEVRRGASSFKPGFDLFYKITPGLTLSLTANTDFGETEADDVQVNLSRFSLFFPEKRQFFLEDAGNFAVDGLTPDSGPLVIIPFFSRRIGISDDGKTVDLLGGGKLSGRIGPYRLGLLSVQTQERDPIPGENFSIIRVKRDLFEQSSIGLIATRRTPENGDATGLTGSDFLYKTTKLFGNKNLTFSSFLLKSFIPGSTKNLAWGSQVNLPNDTWQIFGTYREVQEDFDATMGFVPRNGIRRFGWFLQAAPRPGRWGTRQVSCAFDGNYFADPDTNRLLTRNVNFPCSWRFNTGDEINIQTGERFERLIEDFPIDDGVTIPAGTYAFRRQQVQVQMADQRVIAPQFTYEWGDFFSGKRDDWIARLDFQPGPYFFLSAEYQQNDVRLPEGNFITRLTRLRFDLSLNPNVSWFTLVQYDNRSDILGLNTRFRWIIEPGNDLFLIYDQRWLDSDSSFRSVSRKAQFKARYIYRF